MFQRPISGLIDVHAHLLPGVDDGCANVQQSIACARALVAAGYAELVCTPHVWGGLPNNTVRQIPAMVASLQSELDAAGVPLKLWPGGENNFDELPPDTPLADIVTYRMAGRYVLSDLWSDRLDAAFWRQVERLQRLGLTVILAHPERMRAIQRDPTKLADELAAAGVLLQGNLQCFSDRPGALTRAVADQFLAEGRYFLVGSDLHRLETLPSRLAGLERVRQLLDDATFRQMTIEHPRQMLELP